MICCTQTLMDRPAFSCHSKRIHPEVLSNKCGEGCAGLMQRRISHLWWVPEQTLQAAG